MLKTVQATAELQGSQCPANKSSLYLHTTVTSGFDLKAFDTFIIKGQKSFHEEIHTIARQSNSHQKFEKVYLGLRTEGVKLLGENN